MVLTMRFLDWESRTLNTRFSKMLDRKKEKNSVCSLTNLPSNLVNNVFASVHCLGFSIVTVIFHLEF